MKYKAIVFDLFGTLVNKFPVDESIAVLMEMASVLSVPSDDFINLWFGTFDERHSGTFANLEADIEYVCQKLGVSPENTQIKLAAQINLDYVSSHIVPRPNATELLHYLKERDFKIGLISNWSDEVPSVWKDASLAPFFDVAIFSCLVGMMKPDPRIYRLAAKQMLVEPQECLYIGDGDSQELSGASQAGMHAVLVRDTSIDYADVPPVNNNDDEWEGPVIYSLIEVITLLG